MMIQPGISNENVTTRVKLFLKVIFANSCEGSKLRDLRTARVPARNLPTKISPDQQSNPKEENKLSHSSSGSRDI